MLRSICAATAALSFCTLTAFAESQPPTTNPATRPAIVQAEPAPPGRTALTGNLPAELKVKRAKTGHLLVSPQIDGKDAGWFIFDTGAGMSCIDAKMAEKLALPVAGEASARGSGGVQETRLRKIQSLALGPVLIEDSAVVELNLLPIALAMGEQIDGVIGYECFLAGIFEIDLDAGKITVHDPAKHALPAGQRWQPLTFVKRRPHVSGRIEDHPQGLFLIDIGANTAAVINAPTVKKLGLLDGRETKSAKFGGVGGMLAARSGTIRSLEICGQKLENLTTIFSQADKGNLTDEDVQGTVGVGTLRNFVLIVDYKNRAVALVPRAPK